jgi:hypothetical protein
MISNATDGQKFQNKQFSSLATLPTDNASFIHVNTFTILLNIRVINNGNLLPVKIPLTAA